MREGRGVGVGGGGGWEGGGGGVSGGERGCAEVCGSVHKYRQEIDKTTLTNPE